MAKKYIKTIEVVKQTGRSYNEILDLIKNGVLSAYKTRKGHWRLKIDDVEKHFGIVVKEPSKVQATKVPKPDKGDKLICGRTARKYLGCSKAEFENLVNQGLVTAYRDEDKRWKVSKNSILEYAKRYQSSGAPRLIINEDHYQEVIERICAAKSSIKIMTANFKRFRLKPTEDQGYHYNDGTPFIQYLMEKAVEGVSVQIICSRPSASFTEEWQEYYQQMEEPDLFEYMFCDRNHSKIAVVDDKLAYIGSANVTPAGLGQGVFTPGNFEAGILTEDPGVISSLKEFFSIIWDEKWCINCHRAEKCNEDNR